MLDQFHSMLLEGTVLHGSVEQSRSAQCDCLLVSLSVRRAGANQAEISHDRLPGPSASAARPVCRFYGTLHGLDETKTEEGAEHFQGQPRTLQDDGRSMFMIRKFFFYPPSFTLRPLGKRGVSIIIIIT